MDAVLLERIFFFFIVFSSVLWTWIWILLFRSFRILLFKQGKLSNWQIFKGLLYTVIIIHDELDNFKEKLAKIIQIFLYQIRIR